MLYEVITKVARVLSQKGTALDKLNKHKEAENAFRKAIELAPDVPDNMISLIKLLLKMPGQLDVAVRTRNNFV